jgi:hypothetical protein
MPQHWDSPKGFAVCKSIPVPLEPMTLYKQGVLTVRFLDHIPFSLAQQPAVISPTQSVQAHQFSSPFGFPCIAACLCLSASARPPAILPPLSLTLVPTPLLSTELTPLPLYPLSRAESPGLGAGFLPTGRLAGGAGGLGLPFVGPGRADGAEGAQPDTDLSRRAASHQPAQVKLEKIILDNYIRWYIPLFSIWVTRTISSFVKLSSPAD